MSVNPQVSFINSFTPQYITKAEVVSALQSISSLSSLGTLFTNPIVSSITINPTGSIRGGNLLSTTSILVSSINGNRVATSEVQRADINNFGITNKVISPWPTYTPLVSTTTSFIWNSNALYECSFPFRGVVNNASTDSNASVGFYLGAATSSVPAASASVPTVAGQTNVNIETSANAYIGGVPSGSSPLVLYASIRGAATNATVSADTSITGGSVPVVVNRVS